MSSPRPPVEQISTSELEPSEGRGDGTGNHLNKAPQDNATIWPVAQMRSQAYEPFPNLNHDPEFLKAIRKAYAVGFRAGALWLRDGQPVAHGNDTKQA